ncbi:MAG: glycosyltransferase family 2 protein, partial [bacterium]
WKYRLLEMIPGSLVWTTFILAIVLSFIKPIWVIIFIIIFDLYWLLRIGYFIFWLVISWRKYRQAIEIDWYGKVKEIDNWQRIYHIVIFPTYKEPVEVLRSTFKGLTKVDYDLKKFIVVLAGEERDKDNFLQNAAILEKEFGDQFHKLLITLHPKDLPDEMPGKGSNANWAGHRVQEYIDNQKITYEDVVVSNFDCDTVVHIQYFSYLTYHYLTVDKPTRKSYQPLALYNNNIWESPSLTRVVYNSTTFWLLSELARPERLYTFSSHSMSFKALVDVGFWQKDIVTEDSRICLQGLVRYQGDYSVYPMYIPVSMDTAYCGNFWKTIKNQYKQQRRWAYGVENFPYTAWNLIPDKKVPFWIKFRYLWTQLEGVYSWATAPILILILGRLPLMVAGNREMSTVIAQNAPQILQSLMTVAMIGLFASAIVSTILMPPRPRKYTRFKWLTIVLQWILFPFCMIIFGAIPAADAQTRLMLGKYLGFYVTKKTR